MLLRNNLENNSVPLESRSEKIENQIIDEGMLFSDGYETKFKKLQAHLKKIAHQFPNIELNARLTTIEKQLQAKEVTEEIAYYTLLSELYLTDKKLEHVIKVDAEDLQLFRLRAKLARVLREIFANNSSDYFFIDIYHTAYTFGFETKQLIELLEANALTQTPINQYKYQYIKALYIKNLRIKKSAEIKEYKEIEETCEKIDELCKGALSHCLSLSRAEFAVYWDDEKYLNTLFDLLHTNDQEADERIQIQKNIYDVATHIYDNSIHFSSDGRFNRDLISELYVAFSQLYPTLENKAQGKELCDVVKRLNAYNKKTRILQAQLMVLNASDLAYESRDEFRKNLTAQIAKESMMLDYEAKEISDLLNKLDLDKDFGKLDRKANTNIPWKKILVTGALILSAGLIIIGVIGLAFITGGTSLAVAGLFISAVLAVVGFCGLMGSLANLSEFTSYSQKIAPTFNKASHSLFDFCDRQRKEVCEKITNYKPITFFKWTSKENKSTTFDMNSSPRNQI